MLRKRIFQQYIHCELNIALAHGELRVPKELLKARLDRGSGGLGSLPALPLHKGTAIFSLVL